MMRKENLMKESEDQNDMVDTLRLTLGLRRENYEGQEMKQSVKGQKL